MKTVFVYIKDCCHLCEDMLEKLHAMKNDPSHDMHFSLVIRDIEDREEWYKAYREYVPVVVIDGEEVCHYFFDQTDFMEALSQ